MRPCEVWAGSIDSNIHKSRRNTARRFMVAPTKFGRVRVEHEGREFQLNQWRETPLVFPRGNRRGPLRRITARTRAFQGRSDAESAHAKTIWNSGGETFFDSLNPQRSRMGRMFPELYVGSQWLF